MAKPNIKVIHVNSKEKEIDWNSPEIKEQINTVIEKIFLKLLNDEEQNS